MGWTVYDSSGNLLSSIALVDNVVATAKIADDAVTADKLANSINSEITANTAKVTNATHSGEVTGATALTIAADAVTNAKLANMAANTVKVNATTGSANPTDISMASANLSGAIADDDVLLMYDTSTTSLKTVAKSVLFVGAGGAVTRAGGATAEISMTSTTAALMGTASSISVTATTPFSFSMSGRATAGLAQEGSIGWELSGTVIAEAAGGFFRPWTSSAGNRAEYGGAWVHVSERSANYRGGVQGIASANLSPSGDATTGVINAMLSTAALPNATITSLGLRGIIDGSQNGYMTVAADGINIYAYSTS